MRDRKEDSWDNGTAQVESLKVTLFGATKFWEVMK